MNASILRIIIILTTCYGCADKPSLEREKLAPSSASESTAESEKPMAASESKGDSTKPTPEPGSELKKDSAKPTPATVAVGVVGSSEDAKIELTKILVKNVAKGVSSYTITQRKLPESLEDLLEKKYIKKNQLKDPWSNDLDYNKGNSNNIDDFELCSGGPDGSISGDDDICANSDESESKNDSAKPNPVAANDSKEASAKRIPSVANASGEGTENPAHAESSNGGDFRDIEMKRLPLQPIVDLEEVWALPELSTSTPSLELTASSFLELKTASNSKGTATNNRYGSLRLFYDSGKGSVSVQQIKYKEPIAEFEARIQGEGTGKRVLVGTRMLEGISEKLRNVDSDLGCGLIEIQNLPLTSRSNPNEGNDESTIHRCTTDAGDYCTFEYKVTITGAAGESSSGEFLLTHQFSKTPTEIASAEKKVVVGLFRPTLQDNWEAGYIRIGKDIPPAYAQSLALVDTGIVPTAHRERAKGAQLAKRGEQSSLHDNWGLSDSGPLSSKMAIAMAGDGTEFIMGHGSGGMGFAGTGAGGSSGGFGRIHGMGKIDSGGLSGKGRARKRRRGKIRIGSGRSRGFCRKGDIARVVRRRAGAIRACYEKRLQSKPGLRGKITARWTIGLDGRVRSASPAGNTLGDGATTSCVLRVIRRMRFKKPEGGICIVQWPFVFNPA